MTERRRIGVLGAGSWGTALAIHLARSGHAVRLWARRPDVAESLARERVNAIYLPEARFPDGLEVTADLRDTVATDPVLMVVPSHGYREVLREFLAVRNGGAPLTLVSATKGIEIESLARMSRVSAEEAADAGTALRFAVLSGPTFAAELGVGMPSAAVIASDDAELATELREALASPRFRLYSSHDVVGVELGGAAKNVLAIGAGIVNGLGFGHNTLSVMITRGLHEMTRLGVAFGGDLRTFSGLAGLGDLVLTCTGGLSRNRRTGLELAAGKSLEQILSETRFVSEGVKNSLAIHRLAREKDVEMPIIEQMVALMYEGKSPREALDQLMRRELRDEVEL